MFGLSFVCPKVDYVPDSSVQSLHGRPKLLSRSYYRVSKPRVFVFVVDGFLGMSFDDGRDQPGTNNQESKVVKRHKCYQPAITPLTRVCVFRKECKGSQSSWSPSYCRDNERIGIAASKD